MIDEKKERIITIAEKFFAKFGIKKTTMDEIAKTARMGKSTLYYYFKNKEEIFAEVIQKEAHFMKQKLDEAVREAASPQEKMKAYVLTRMKRLKELSNYYCTLTDQYLEYYSFVEKERADFTSYEIKSIKNILVEGSEKGIFSVEDVDATAWAIVISMKGLEYPLLLRNSGEDMETEINKLLGILFKGIETR
jgi:AcrR family transcriptional regulator